MLYSVRIETEDHNAIIAAYLSGEGSQIAFKHEIRMFEKPVSDAPRPRSGGEDSLNLVTTGTIKNPIEIVTAFAVDFASKYALCVAAKLSAQAIRELTNAYQLDKRRTAQAKPSERMFNMVGIIQKRKKLLGTEAAGILRSCALPSAFLAASGFIDLDSLF